MGTLTRGLSGVGQSVENTFYRHRLPTRPSTLRPVAFCFEAGADPTKDAQEVKIPDKNHCNAGRSQDI